MSDLVRGMILGAVIALYVAWLLFDFVPVLRMYAFRSSVLRDAEWRLAAAEARMKRGFVSRRDAARTVAHPPEDQRILERLYDRVKDDRRRGKW